METMKQSQRILNEFCSGGLNDTFDFVRIQTVLSFSLLLLQSKKNVIILIFNLMLKSNNMFEAFKVLSDVWS